MDPLFAEIIRTQRVITRAILQVHLLNRHLAEIKTRYNHAREMQLSMWVYKLRMRTLTVEGVKNVFMQLLEEKMEKLELLQEQQYWQEMEVDEEEEEEDEDEWEEEYTSVRSSSESDLDTSFHSAHEPDHEHTSYLQETNMSGRTLERSSQQMLEADLNSTLLSLEED